MFKNILILYGSGSGELDVSFKSATFIKSIVDKKTQRESILLEFNQDNFIEKILSINPDFVINITHGKYGEDGLVPKILDFYGIKYSHCGSNSILTFNKIITKRICKSKIKNFKNIKYAKDFFIDISLCFDKKNDFIFKKSEEINTFFKDSEFLIFKPNESGSSLGLFKVKNKISDISDIICKIRSNFLDRNYIIEEFINGIETTSCVIESIESTNLKTLPISIDLSHNSEKTFDYDEKYSSSSLAKHIVNHQNIDKSLLDEINKFSEECHLLFGCSFVSRSDFIVTKDSAYFFEINTHPGFTERSFIPEAIRYFYDIEEYFDKKFNLSN